MLGVSNKVLITQHKPGHLFTTSSTLWMPQGLVVRRHHRHHYYSNAQLLKRPWQLFPHCWTSISMSLTCWSCFSMLLLPLHLHLHCPSFKLYLITLSLFLHMPWLNLLYHSTSLHFNLNFLITSATRFKGKDSQAPTSFIWFLCRSFMTWASNVVR